MAPTIAGTSILTKKEDQLVNTLASLSTFQMWTGAGTPTAAKAHIFVDVQSIKNQGVYQANLPAATFTLADDAGMVVSHDADGFGNRQYNLERIAFEIIFEAAVDVTEDYEDQYRRLKNDINGIVDQLTDSAVITPDDFQVTSYTALGNAKVHLDGQAAVENAAGMMFVIEESVESGGTT